MRESGDVDGVVDVHVLVVLGQRDNVSFRRHSQAAASAHLHVRALELRGHRAIALQHHDVETIAVAVADQNVTGVARVNAVGVCRQRLVPETTDKLAVLRKHGDAVALKCKIPIQNIEIIAGLKQLMHIVNSQNDFTQTCTTSVGWTVEYYLLEEYGSSAHPMFV